MTLLSLSNLSASYQSAQALFDVNITVPEGAVVALMGRNGMGKSTTIKCICRMLPSNGEIRFDGIDIMRLASHQAARLGIGLVPEGRRCFSNLSVRENLIAAARPGHWSLSTVVDLFPRLGERSHQLASSLSGGEQQMLVIGRALMTNPKLLILDEATEGLAPIIRREIWIAVEQLKSETGLSIIVVDKSVNELKRVCDTGVVLERGRSIWSGSMESLTAELIESYLGV